MADTRCGDCGWPVIWEADYDGSLWTSCGECSAYASTSREEADRRG